MIPLEKDLAAFVFRMIDDSAAQYADFAQWIEDRDIGGRFCIAERVIILGIEEARILYRHHGRLALPFDTGWTEIDHPVSNEFVHPRDATPASGAASLRTGAFRLQEARACVPGIFPGRSSIPSFSLCISAPSASTCFLVGVNPGINLATSYASSSTRWNADKFFVSLR